MVNWSVFGQLLFTRLLSCLFHCISIFYLAFCTSTSAFLPQIFDKMSENSDSDKTTIRVKISDDYQDIVLDWSIKDMKDMKRSMFDQISAFTKISREKTTRYYFLRPISIEDYNASPFTIFTNISYVQPDLLGAPAYLCLNSRDGPHDYRFTIQDMKDKFFRDGDCFILQLNLALSMNLDKTEVVYKLIHQDLIDETECIDGVCIQYCCHTNNRSFWDKQAEILNSDIDSYLLDQARTFQANPDFMNAEFYVVREKRKREILADLNIGQYFNSFCSPYCSVFARGPKPRIYLPYRG